VVTRGPAATAPTINNAIGGSLNFITDQTVAHPGGHLSFSTDGQGGSVAHIDYANRLVNNRLDYRFAYDATNFTGPYNGTMLPMVAVPFYFSAINGQPFTCPTGCGGSVSQPNPAYTFQFQDQHGLVACCFPNYTIQTQKSYATRIGYELSPATNVSVFMTGTSNYRQNPNNVSLLKFVAPPGYAGPLASGQPFVGTFGWWTDEMKGNAPLFEVNLHTKFLGGDFRYSFLNYQYYVDRLYSFPPAYGAVPATLNGTATIGGTAQVFNNQPVMLTFKPSFQLIHDTEWSRDALFEYSIPIAANLLSVSYERTYIASNYDGGFGPSLSAITPFAVSKGVTARYGELRIRAIAQVSPKFEVTGAVYFNQYSNTVPTAGTASTFVGPPTAPPSYTVVNSRYTAPRLGLVYRPSSDDALRFAVGSAITPIPLSDYVFGNSAPTLNAGCGCYQQTIGSNSLVPETATGIDFGADHRFGRNQVVSLDLYSTLLRNQFFTQQALTGTFKGLPLYQTSPGNLGSSAFRGVEFAYRYSPPIGLGGSVQGSLMRAYTYNLPPGFYATASGGPLAANLTIIPNINFNGAGALARVPYAQGYAEVNYNGLRGWYASLGLNYYGNNNAYYRPAFAALTANLRVPISKRVTLQLTRTNLTNVYPLPVDYLTDYTGLPQVNGKLQPFNYDNYGPQVLKVNLSYKL